MPRSIKRKTGGKNDARVYQVGNSLSTQEVSRAGLSRWLQGVLADHPPHVWLLSGPLGAGKTTLVQELGRLLGVRGDITSPTFSLQKIHPLRGQPWRRLVHLDAYRLKGVHETAALELEDYISNPENLVVVEWPERLSGFAWGPHAQITLSTGKALSWRRVRFQRR